MKEVTKGIEVKMMECEWEEVESVLELVKDKGGVVGTMLITGFRFGNECIKRGVTPEQLGMHLAKEGIENLIKRKGGDSFA